MSNATAPAVSSQTINGWVDRAIATTPVYDLHTHLYPASFGRFNLWGIEELLTYHYLIAETMRARSDVPYETYWKMPQREQANLIWQTLFVERAPISEACRGVLTVLKRLGIDTSTKKLDDIRAYFKDQKAEGYVDKCFQLSNVHTVVMTNDGFDPAERDLWMSKGNDDKRYKGVLRIDPLLYQWPDVAGKLSGFGYKVGSDLGATSMAEIRRYLNEWIDRLGALYVAVSLTPDWRYPDDTPGTRVIDEAIVPVTRERNMPFAVMIGVRRQVNPQLKLAGDGVGTSDVYSLDRMLALNPKNKFMCTMLARENQHELTVTARKHRNLFLFGCWWFLNNPVLIEEMTRMRMELLGTSFTPQHSDARVLDQIIYKWDHSRAIIGKVLKDKFNDAAAAGWHVTEDEVKRTVKGYLDTNFPDFLKATIA